LQFAAGYMLETPSIRRYRSCRWPALTCRAVIRGGDNVSGADNQQERPGIEQWIVGFVDGIVPFFERYPLRTAKALEFDRFADVVRRMRRGEHLTVQGLAEIATIAATMNFRKPSRFLESSEAIRQPPRVDVPR
jgi:hypothetical protein